MFKFLKRIAPGAKKPGTPPAIVTRPASTRSRGWTQPSPLDGLHLPEVEESDDESVWDQWEHSQMELDSRMGPLSVYDTVKVKNPTPSQFSGLDPFEEIRRRR